MSVVKRGGFATIEDIAEERKNKGGDEYRFSVKNAIPIIRHALWEKLPIVVIGDYDCDGVCATAIMLMVLKSLGGNVTVRLPLRFSEGYGMNADMIDEIESGLVITVDNGITALEAAKAAKDKGLELIITDHHLPMNDNGINILPEADCVIDPHYEEAEGIDGMYDFAGYCGAGIALKLCESLLADIGEPVDELFLDKLYALAALATVGDAMELVEDNRRICRRGISAMVNGRITKGLAQLLSDNGFGFIGSVNADNLPSPWMLITGGDLGFKIAPCINAPSRLVESAGKGAYHYVREGGDGAKISLLCVLSENDEKARRFSDALGQYNRVRRNVSEEGYKKAESEIEAAGIGGDSPIVLVTEDMKPGIVGIVAGRLCEKYGAPIVLLTNGEEGMYHGSCRSPEGFNIREALDYAAAHFEAYGGHAGAAGVSIRSEKIEDCRKALQEYCRGFRVEKSEATEYDLEINEEDIKAVLEIMERDLAPFGNGNPEPVFLIRNFRIRQSMVLSGKHIKLCGRGVDAIGFGFAEDGELPQTVESEKTVDIVGRLGYNFYRGRVTPQIQIEAIL